jgi:tRNA (cmo5U34)-methyltransferase
VLFDHIPLTAKRILDLGTGDGRLLRLLKMSRPEIEAVAIDVSPTMINSVKKNFADDKLVRIVEHNLQDPLPELGYFDAIISSFAIHHLTHQRKYSLYTEVFFALRPGGIFCNLEHVASPTKNLHQIFLSTVGKTMDTEDKSNKLLDMGVQLEWLHNIGFIDADCYWKWLELALLIGFRP